MQHRRHHAISVQQASQEAPELVQLLRLNQESQQRLRSIMALVPPGLRASVQAGPIEGSTWSVHVPRPRRRPSCASCCRPLPPICAVKGGMCSTFGCMSYRKTDSAWGIKKAASGATGQLFLK